MNTAEPLIADRFDGRARLRGDDQDMPSVTVDMYEGRSTEQKQALVAAITDAMVEHAGASPECLHVIIHDVPKENWGRNGQLGIYRED